MRFTFNPGNFGEMMGHLDGTTAALESEEVSRSIAEAFLRFSMEKAMDGVDQEAGLMASGDITGRGRLAYAYAGANPRNIGLEEYRLFDASQVTGMGGTYSITYETLEDREPAWSPTLLEETDYIFADRMDAAIRGDAGTVFAPSSMGKKAYAVGLDGEEVIYRRSFSYDFAEQYDNDFDEVLGDKMDQALGATVAVVNAGVQSAVTKSYNAKVGVSGSTGFARKVMDGYSANFKSAGRLLKRFMIERMSDVIKGAQ